MNPSPPPPPLSFFDFRFISRTVKTENPFPRSFLLLRNQTETLATQATRYSQSSRDNASPSSGTSPLDSYKESII